MTYHFDQNYISELLNATRQDDKAKARIAEYLKDFDEALVPELLFATQWLRGELLAWCHGENA